MDEDVRKPSKAYTLDDLLALTKNSGDNISPASGAKDWIENPTRFKLREARHFLVVSLYCVVAVRDYDSSKKFFYCPDMIC